MRRAARTASLLLAAAMACVPAAATVRLNELMASNGATIADENGDFEDWIEIVNTGPTPVSLAGYGLSDRDDTPFRWVFPALTLQPGAFLLIWASGKDRRDPEAPLHTGFSIAAEGEPILLTRADGALLDRLDPVEIPRDISIGRQPDGAGDWIFFVAPTPAAPNSGEGHLGVLDPPAPSHEGGFYTAPFTLSLATQTGGATIYYTLDGSFPDSANRTGTTYHYKQQFPNLPLLPLGELIPATYQTLRYQSPIAIADRSPEPDRLTQRSTTYDADPSRYLPKEPVFKGVVVRARAEAPGFLPSDTITHTYFITPEGPGRFNLPVFALAMQEDHLYDYERGIHTAGIDFDQWRLANPESNSTHGHRPANYHRRGREWEIPVMLEIFDGDQHAALRQGLGLRIHAGSSRSHPQKTFRLHARRDYDVESTLRYPLFPGLTDRHEGAPLDEFDTFLLRTSGNDSANDPLSYQALTATRIRDAFQQRLLEHLGLDGQAYEPAVHFINGEYWGLINIRERIDGPMLARRYGLERDNIILLSGDAWVQEGAESDAQEWQDLRTYIANQDMADPTHFAYVAERLDLDNFLTYHAAMIYLAAVDWPGNNIDFWRTRTPDRSHGAHPAHDGRWRWIVYDLDHAFQLWSHQTLQTATGALDPTPAAPEWSTVILRKLLENQAFRHAFINTLADLMNSAFVPNHVHAVIDDMYGRILPYLEEHARRWPHTGNTSPQVFKSFAYARPSLMRGQLVAHFRLTGQYTLTINTGHERGSVRVNSLVINPALPGADPASPYPWSGVYFLGVPIELEATAAPGYYFAGWSGIATNDPLTTLSPEGPLTITALFLPGDALPGDINGDGLVNAVDVQLVINAALGIALEQGLNADINGDGLVNAVDVQLVINAALGIAIGE